VSAVLHVCVTCRAGGGQAVLDAVTRARDDVSRETIHEYTLISTCEVRCLAACERPCTATIAAPGKWRILLGHLDPSMARDLLDYAVLYQASPTGMVMPSRRAPTLRHAVLGRLPA
jgi:predicted metal-binding protein